MRKMLCLILVSALIARCGHAQDVRTLVRDTAPKQGSDYIRARDRVVGLGEQAVPGLEGIIVDPGLTWQQRAMASICLERIQRNGAIQAFVNYDWLQDPELKGDPGWMNRVGFPRQFYSVVQKRMIETGLSAYYLELAWKQIDEHPRLGRDWDVRAAMVLEKQTNPYLTGLARERVQNIGQRPDGTPAIQGNWFYDYLLRVRDQESLPLLFDLWIKYRAMELPRSYNHYEETNPSRSDADISGFAVDQVDARLSSLLTAATTNDESWILAKLKDIKLGVQGRQFLAVYERRCRGQVESGSNNVSSWSSEKSPSSR